MSTSFSLRIFAADSDPDGLRIVESFNSRTRAVVFPRALLPQEAACRCVGPQRQRAH